MKLFGKKNTDKNKTLIWERSYDENEKDRQMIYRIPNREIQNFDGYDYLGVRGYEKAIYFRSGVTNTLNEGTYEIEKEDRNAASEIIWFDPSIVTLTWAVGHMGGNSPTSKDGYQVGANGEFIIQINDPETLIKEVIAGKPNFTDEDFKELIKKLVIDAFRTVFGQFTLSKFFALGRDRLTSRMRTDLHDEFRGYGVDLRTVLHLGSIGPDRTKDEMQKIINRFQRDSGDLEEEIEEIGDSISKVRKGYRAKISETDDDVLADHLKDERDKKLEKLKEERESLEDEIDEMRAKIARLSEVVNR